MSKRKNKKSQQAEVVEEEKLLYNAPKVEKVISDSPGLEDDEHPELSPEELERATLAFHTKQDPGGRITREHLKGLSSRCASSSRATSTSGSWKRRTWAPDPSTRTTSATSTPG
ncbi:hypothetical protein JL721_12391 [Aureococcus anophagefferens]|nr:hypothetical protein JL721_12391 [Aureococcus anophagefferens]